MVATPPRLHDILRLNGYEIVDHEIAAASITLPEGVVKIPAMLGSALEWRRAGEAPSWAALYLDRLPVFSEVYRPVMLSTILDHFGSRRIGYNTPDEFAQAVKRWGNLHLGAGSILNRRYASAAVPLPLTTIDTALNATTAEATTGTSSADDTASSTDTTAGTSKERSANSDFPQGQLAGDLDYATDANDRVGDATQTGSGSTTAHSAGSTAGSRNGTETRTMSGRDGATVMELLEQQRDSFINAEEEFKREFESLFLGVFDLGEREGSGPPFYHGDYWR